MYFFPTLMCNHHQDQMNDIDIIQSQPFSSLPHYFALIWVTVKTVTSNWPRSGNFENHACVQLFATVYTITPARSGLRQNDRKRILNNQDTIFFAIFFQGGWDIHLQRPVLLSQTVYVILSFGGRIYTQAIFTLEIYALEIYTLEIYTLEIYTLEIYTLEIYALEIYTLEIYTLEILLDFI